MAVMYETTRKHAFVVLKKISKDTNSQEAVKTHSFIPTGFKSILSFVCYQSLNCSIFWFLLPWIND
jgi:hypothetical protein